MMKNFIRTFAGFLLAILLILGLFLLAFPKAGDRFRTEKKVSALSAKHVSYAALGDSLTEGVGGEEVVQEYQPVVHRLRLSASA